MRAGGGEAGGLPEAVGDAGVIFEKGDVRGWRIAWKACWAMVRGWRHCGRMRRRIWSGTGGGDAEQYLGVMEELAMIVVSHRRECVCACAPGGAGKEGRLERFFTTVVDVNGGLYPISPSRMETSPSGIGAAGVAAHGNSAHPARDGWASVDAVPGAGQEGGRDFEQKRTKKQRGDEWVYGYEDGALETFRAARDAGVRRAYELPIAYWETRGGCSEERRGCRVGADARSTRDSDEKNGTKTEELELANA